MTKLKVKDFTNFSMLESVLITNIGANLAREMLDKTFYHIINSIS
jgi:hypothetical protein